MHICRHTAAITVQTTERIEELKIEERRGKERKRGREYLNVNEFTVQRHKRRPVYKSDNAKRCCLWIIMAIRIVERRNRGAW